MGYRVRIFLLVLLSATCVSTASAVEVVVKGSIFNSFQEYADFRDPRPCKIPFVKDKFVLMPRFVIHLGFQDMRIVRVTQQPRRIPQDNIAGVTPSMIRIMQDLHRPELPARPVYSREGLISAMQQAARGKTGPLLLIGDRSKLKMMELQPLPSAGGMGLGTNP